MPFLHRLRPLAVAAPLLSLLAVPALAAPRAKGAPAPPVRATAAGRCAGLVQDAAVAGCFHGRAAKMSGHDPQGGPKGQDPSDPNPPSGDFGPSQSSTIDPNGANGRTAP